MADKVQHTPENAQRFRGGLVFKDHRLCMSLNPRLHSNTEEEKNSPKSKGSTFFFVNFALSRVQTRHVMKAVTPNRLGMVAARPKRLLKP